MKKKTIRKALNISWLAAASFLVIQFVGCSPSDRYIRDRVVRISSERGMCSGEQVTAPSGTSYILSASHCKGLMHDGSFTITTESGVNLERRLIAEDPRSDLILIEGLPGVSGLAVAKYDYPSEAIRGFTHGHNHSTYTSPGQILETQEVQIPIFEIKDDVDAAAHCSMPKYKDTSLDTFFGTVRVCELDNYQTVTNGSISPGSSGGPFVDDSGALVGVVSAGDGVFGSLVTLVDIRAFLSAY